MYVYANDQIRQMRLQFYIYKPTHIHTHMYIYVCLMPQMPLVFWHVCIWLHVAVIASAVTVFFLVVVVACIALKPENK